MAGLGTAKGLSFVNDWSGDIDRLYQREEYAAKVRSEKEQKTQYYANLLKKGHGSTPRAEAELNAYYKDVNNELADFVVENPNFETDVNAMQQFMGISDKYLNNNILQRDLQVKQQFDNLREAVGKKELTQDEYEKEMARYDAYINSDPKDNIEPYVFQNFAKIEVEDLIKMGADQLESETNVVFNAKSHTWDTKEDVPELRLSDKANAMYANEKYRGTIDKRFEDYAKNNPSAAKDYTPITWFSNQLKIAKQIKQSMGVYDLDYKLRSEAAAKGQENRHPYVFENTLWKVGDMLRAKNDNGEYVDTEMPANNYDMNLTTLGPTKQTVLSGNSGAKVFDKSQNKYVDFNLSGKPVSIKGNASSRMVTVMGVPYLEVDSEFQNPYLGKDSPTYNVPEGWQFTSEKTESSPLIDLGKESGSTTFLGGQTHKGKILLPMNFETPRLVAWEDDYLGKENAKVKADDYADNAMRYMAEKPELLLYQFKKNYAPMGASVDKNNAFNNSLNEKYGTPNRFLNVTMTERGADGKTTTVNRIYDAYLDSFHDILNK